MSTHMPVLFLKFFLHHLVLAKLAITGILLPESVHQSNQVILDLAIVNILGILFFMGDHNILRLQP